MTIIVRNTMARAIVTKFYAPTATKGSRIKVSAYGSHMWVDWRDDLGIEHNHDRAAGLFLTDKCWGGEWIGGTSPDGTGYYYVNT